MNAQTGNWRGPHATRFQGEASIEDKVVSDEPKRWLNVDQLLGIVPLKRSRLYYLTHTGQIPCTRIGRTLLFEYDRIVRWLEESNNGTDGRVPNEKGQRSLVCEVSKAG